MIGQAIAGWIGNRIDRRDGKGGTLGTLAGVATYALGKRALPVMLVAGGAVLAARAIRNRRNAPA
jgi:energy-converting hydrogenase Eha subunit B